MNQLRNEKCDCGSGKKYKNCCMENTGESYLKKNMVKIAIVIFSLLLTVSIADRYFNADPVVWCYECKKWVPENSTGHQTEPFPEN
tara:strand:+ start:66 stop:323 length:258 start_codon:yes stop_codon:yes gene_type:complete